MSRPRPTYFASPLAFRRWLEQHADSATELEVGFHKRGSGTPSITWPEAVDEALCFGWIDGVRHRIDETRYRIRFTPRKPSSRWSAVNIARVEALAAEGRMRPAGLTAFAMRTAERSRTASYEQADVPALEAAEEKTFRGRARAWSFFEAQPPSYRRKALWWVVSAKKPETRAARLQRLIAASGEGMRL